MSFCALAPLREEFSNQCSVGSKQYSLCGFVALRDCLVDSRSFQKWLVISMQGSAVSYQYLLCVLAASREGFSTQLAVVSDQLAITVTIFSEQLQKI